MRKLDLADLTGLICILVRWPFDQRHPLLPLSEFELHEVADEALLTVIFGPPVR